MSLYFQTSPYDGQKQCSLLFKHGHVCCVLNLSENKLAHILIDRWFCHHIPHQKE